MKTDALLVEPHIEISVASCIFFKGWVQTLAEVVDVYMCIFSVIYLLLLFKWEFGEISQVLPIVSVTEIDRAVAGAA